MISLDLGFVELGGLTEMDPTAECRLSFGANPDAELLRHGITLVGVLKVVTVSQELRRSRYAPNMSRHSAVGSISVSPPRSTKPRSREIMQR